MTIENTAAQIRTILDLNTTIHKDNSSFSYLMTHIELARKYALIINEKLGSKVSNQKLEFIALAHDILKEKSLDPAKTLDWNGHKIPMDLKIYIKDNLDVLKEFDGIDTHFNGEVEIDLEIHPIAAAIFLHKELGITDREILFPVMFHSCPIIDIYLNLSPTEQLMVDIIMLADKLSSNYLKINMRGKKNVYIDLDKLVFGADGNEFNYSAGLYAARIVGQGKSKEIQSLITTDYYFKRLKAQNPLMTNKITMKKLGGNDPCTKRESKLWIMQ